MELYDDRPISVYDNLHPAAGAATAAAATANTGRAMMHTSTPKAKAKVHVHTPAAGSSAMSMAFKSPASAQAPTPVPVPVPASAPAYKTNGGAKAHLMYDAAQDGGGGGECDSSHYTELAFKFDDNTNTNTTPTSTAAKSLYQQQQQQVFNNNHNRVNAHNNNHINLNSIQQQQQHQQLQANDVVYYATPFKTTSKPAIATAPPQTTTATTSKTTAAATTPTATMTPTSLSALASASMNAQQPQPQQQQQQQQPTYASPVRIVGMHKQQRRTPQQQPQQRPLSQHSQSEVNEACQNIAAVKAALNDAKSKFFGLSENQQQQHQPQQQQQQQHAHQQQMPIVQNTTTATAQNPANDPPTTTAATATQPLPIGRAQPKYQNIPENSAIYRNNNQPPALPPKPIKSYSPIKDATPTTITPQALQQPTLTPTTPATTSSAPAAAAATATVISMPLSPAQTPAAPAAPMSQTTTTPLGGRMSPRASPEYQHQHSPSPQPSKILPYSTYQQLPLNDVESPSQAVYMSTTVPQNIKGSKISGRHTPTRNSLRHSRMLVVNTKTYRELQQPNPMNFVYPQLARWLLILQLIIGFLLGILSIWILFLAPSTPIHDNPYWSGLALILTGLIGLVLIRYPRIKRHKVREKCFLFLRADSYMLSLLAIVLCCAALTCAAIHHYRISASDTHCESTNPLLEHGSCTCTFNAVTMATAANESKVTDIGQRLKTGATTRTSHIDDNELYDRSYAVEYRDLTCQEVKCEWIYVLVVSIVLNSLGLIISVFYIMMLACYRRSSKALYATVHSSTF